MYYRLSLHLCTTQNHLCSRFLYMYDCARTLYIEKSIKPLYLPFVAVFRLKCMFVLSFVFGTFAAAYLVRFRLSRLFLNKVDVWIFALFVLAFCFRFLFRSILNWKLFGNFEFFSTFAETFYLFTFCSFAFPLILDNLQKTKTETKKPIFGVFLLENVPFCRK